MVKIRNKNKSLFLVPQTTIVIKVQTTGADGDFNFSAIGFSLPANFTIGTIGNVGQKSFVVDSWDTYDFAEELPKDWSLKDINCSQSSNQSRASINSNAVEIFADAWETVTCIF